MFRFRRVVIRIQGNVGHPKVKKGEKKLVKPDEMVRKVELMEPAVCSLLELVAASGQEKTNWGKKNR